MRGRYSLQILLAYLCCLYIVIKEAVVAGVADVAVALIVHSGNNIVILCCPL